MVIMTRGPIHIIALMRTRVRSDHGADDAAADFAEYAAAGDPRDIELPGQPVDRRGVEEHRIQRDIEHEHEQRPRQQRASSSAAACASRDDVGRGVPSENEYITNTSPIPNGALATCARSEACGANDTVAACR